MTQPTLFERRPPATYPEAAGYKTSGTSQEAAATVPAAFLREEVRRCLATHFPMTADECAATLQIDRLSIRPRFTELQRTGEVVDTGERRRNASGKRARVWRLTS